MEELTFEDGTLVRQRPLSYGTVPRRTAIDPPAHRMPERVALVERRRVLA